MDNLIILILCSLLLIAFIFDISSSVTNIPSVLLLFILGWLCNQLSILFNISIPDLHPVLPILGIFGLVLIVLEGALEIKIDSNNFYLLGKAFLFSLATMLLLWVLISSAFYMFGYGSIRICLINSLPFCVISSAIAIPSVQKLSEKYKHFVIIESSFSDIIGVIIFNFLLFNESFSASSFFGFAVEFSIMIIISLIAIVILTFILSKINHHVSYTPIILLVIIVYSVSKIFHLPALVFIVLIGIFLANIGSLESYSWFRKLHPKNLKRELNKFKTITHELTFLIRSLFFILFGFLMNSNEILNLSSLPWAVGIVVLIYLVRYAILSASKLPVQPLLYIAPRGLITILLFVNIQESNSIQLVNNSLIIQTILISVIIMSFGLFRHKLKTPELDYESSFFS